MNIFGTKGKTHIEGHKSLTTSAPILELAKEKVAKVYLPLLSPNGKEIKVCVADGDRVLVGTKYAERTDFYVPQYSPIAGTVLGKEMRYSAVVGRPINHLVIENDFTYEEAKDVLKVVSIDDSKEVIFEAIKEAGLVGLGGAGFPTYVKYNNPQNIHTILVNAVECEPYLTTDFFATQMEPEMLCKALQFLIKVSGAEKAIIAYKQHKGVEKEPMEAALEPIVANYPNVELRRVPDVYPMGWERLLVKTVFNKEYKMLPSEVGVIVNNVQTVIALGHALIEGKPLTRRLVTISGDGIANPCNIWCPIGTPAKTLIDECGGYTADDVNVVPGGPMCTKAVLKDEFPINAQTGAVTVYKYKYVAAEPCLRCGACSDHCPMGLQPVELQIALKTRDTDRMAKLKGNLCMSCGMCSYVCPSKIDVTGNMNKMKLQLKLAQMKK